MKNLFVMLTAPIGSSAPRTTRIAINMSRVQEMWPQPDGSSRLVMNIPDADVMVMESVPTILQKIEDINKEPSQQDHQGAAGPRMISAAAMVEIIKEVQQTRRHVFDTSYNRGTRDAEQGKIEVLEYLLGLEMLHG